MPGGVGKDHLRKLPFEKTEVLALHQTVIVRNQLKPSAPIFLRSGHVRFYFFPFFFEAGFFAFEFLFIFTAFSHANFEFVKCPFFAVS